MTTYLGLFLVALSALGLEISLVRLLSVTTWYHLSFFAISTAMLGMTAGATWVYVRPDAFNPQRFRQAIVSGCHHMAFSIPLALIVLCLVPVVAHGSIIGLASMLITTLACALPFFYAGTVISAVLTKQELPMGRLYASDLLGASLGCLFVLGGMEVLDAPSLILMCAAVAALGALSFAWHGPDREQRRVSATAFICLALVACLNSATPRGVRPVVVKGRQIEIPGSHLVERWNSFSRVAVSQPTLGVPFCWGPSPLAPKEPILQYHMNIDGDAGTYMCRFRSPADVEHLRYDVTTIAYRLRRGGPACVIGVGAGRDVQSALIFGHAPVTGIEINPIFVNLLQRDFADVAGIGHHPQVTLVTAEARSHLSHTADRYNMLQMSLIDTWAATGAGAFALSENCLYTVEAWRLFLGRLTDQGIFTVSRWHSPTAIGETGRVLSLAVAALIDLGVQDPAHHLALITAGRCATLIMGRQPLSDTDIATLRQAAQSLQFRALLLPDQPPADPLLRAIVQARTRAELETAVDPALLNYRPPTDESPYFFNMLRLGRLGQLRQALGPGGGVAQGNLVATLTLVALLVILAVVAVATIILPLRYRTRAGIGRGVSARTLRSGAWYFSLIGAGFMLTEIALIQRLTVVLSHPTYALGILLFTLIASSGIGSLLSDRLPLTRKPWLYVYPLLAAACIIGLRFLMSAVLPDLVTQSLAVKIAASVGMIFPLGLLLGVFFPTGMRMAKAAAAADTPWYWALNGVFGVLCSALAVLISIMISVSTNFYIAAVCYAAVALVNGGLAPRSLQAAEDPAEASGSSSACRE